MRLAIEEGLQNFLLNLWRSAIARIRRGIVILEGLEVQLGKGRRVKTSQIALFPIAKFNNFSTLYTVSSD